MKRNAVMGLALLMLGSLACQPVLAIGWREGLVILILAGMVFGPPIYRFLRWLEEFRKGARPRRDE